MARRVSENHYGWKYTLLLFSTPFTILLLGKLFALCGAFLFSWETHDVLIKQPLLWMLWSLAVVIANIYLALCIDEDRMNTRRRERGLL